MYLLHQSKRRRIAQFALIEKFINIFFSVSHIEIYGQSTDIFSYRNPRIRYQTSQHTKKPSSNPSSRRCLELSNSPHARTKLNREIWKSFSHQIFSLIQQQLPRNKRKKSGETNDSVRNEVGKTARGEKDEQREEDVILVKRILHRLLANMTARGGENLTTMLSSLCDNSTSDTFFLLWFQNVQHILRGMFITVWISNMRRRGGVELWTRYWHKFPVNQGVWYYIIALWNIKRPRMCRDFKRANIKFVFFWRQTSFWMFYEAF